VSAAQERLLLGAVTVSVAAMMALSNDDERYRRCVRADVHFVAARAAFDDGRLLVARREAQEVETLCPRSAASIRDLELSAMVGLGECSDAKDLAWTIPRDPPPCTVPDRHELANKAIAAMHAGHALEARRLFEGALGFSTPLRAGEPVTFTGDSERFGDTVIACVNDGIVRIDLKTEKPTFLRRRDDGEFNACLLAPKGMAAYVNGAMVDVVNDVDLWVGGGVGVAFSADGEVLLERAQWKKLLLRIARTGEVLHTFDEDTEGSVYAIGKTFQWETSHERREWVVLAIDPPSITHTIAARTDNLLDATNEHYRVVLDKDQSAIVITNLATHKNLTIPTKTKAINRIALTEDVLITHSATSTRQYDLVTGEELVLSGSGLGRRLYENTHGVTPHSGSSLTVMDGRAKREIFLDAIPVTSVEQVLSLLQTTIPLTCDATVDETSQLLVTCGSRELHVQLFARGRAFIESAGLFDVVGAVPVECFVFGESNHPLPHEACEQRRVPGLLSAFLAPR
jgi:hypothetical protein